MIVHLTLAHSQHHIGCAPNVITIIYFSSYDLDAPHEMSHFFKSANSTGKLRSLFIPILVLQLVEEYVIVLFGQEQILVLRCNL